ncbi:sensor histidine kinase [Pedobacter gandavensis]|uniref:sensor histidine kinase n=1 Tax=Pedobacter gandavensis TaxID=2679963 RepID=UPI0029306AC7|nr:sensor histidine kinase [Pedobacter gandavensis]
MQKKNVFNFPLIFEAMIWLFYVGFYKYSNLVEHANLPKVKNGYFPYHQIGLYAIVSTLYLIPYYRWAVPKLLYLRRYLLLFLLTLVVFVFIATYNNIGIAWIFLQFTSNEPVSAFFKMQSAGFFMDWNMIMTDFIAFLSIAFSRFSYQNERERAAIEKDHLELQLTMLKNQLQPHFLFNTLNSLYGMSLTGSKDTPRFILLLSNMMQYILYDCDQPMVSVKAELEFMKGYFELEQKKYPDASINLLIHEFPQDLEIPPMLLLPLIENSFKHGKHKVENNSSVYAEFMIKDQKLEFLITNDKLSSLPFQMKKLPGGIGLVNIKKRLELYYPGKYELLFTENDLSYSVKLIITL